MRTVCFLFCLLQVVLGVLECAETKNYAKFVKRTAEMGYDESFEVLDHTGDVVYEGENFDVDDTQTLEACLDVTPTNKYTLIMKSFIQDGWDNTGFIAVYGINGNIVIKDTGFAERTVSEFSLYSPIRKGNSWKFSSTFASGWTAYSFSDADWQTAATGAVGTQYFRKTFAGVSNMAAIDAEFKYKFGIVAYINGEELFRDNMPDGEPAQTTLATGQYTALEYRGVIRSAQIASSAQSVMAVELHFMESNHEQAIDFDGFLSYLAANSNTTDCYNLATSMTATSTAVQEVESVFDYSINYYGSVSSSNLPATITVSFNGNARPVVNGIRIWPYSDPTYAPTSFTLSGAGSISQTEWTNVVTTENAHFKSREWYELKTVGEMTRFGAMRLTVGASMESSVRLYEVQFLICMANANIEYELTQNSFYKDYNTLDLHTKVLGFTGCQVSPAFPQGVTLSDDCSITGTATVSVAQTTYVLTAMAGSRQATGSLTLSFPECSGSIYRIVRSYSSDAAKEAYRIRNSVTDELLYEVPIGNSHANNEDRTEYICITVDRFDITVDGSSLYWGRLSYIYVYNWLPEGEWELILRARYDAKQGNEASYYLRRNTVNPVSDWYYKSGEVPANWYDDSTSGWTAYHRGTFPDSSNSIQLYKKSFTLSDVSVVSGYILSIRYRYGCIVYLNGQEAWRNHVTGTLSASSVANESYQELKYRVVTLPGRSISSSGSVQYLKQGTNTIAIALVAISPSTQKESHFDAVVRLMTNQVESHIWEYTTTQVKTNAPLSNAFDGYSPLTYYYNKCAENEGILTLDNDRREWVSSVEVQNSVSQLTMNPKSFSLYGRNSASEEWTLLKAVDGMTFSLMGQKHRIYFVNNVPYNQFRFANFATGDSTACTWRVQSLALYADNVLAEQAPLTYPATVEVYKDIEMAEVVPEGVGYSNYAISPELPSGLVFDSITGWISGTTSSLMSAQTYTVTANSFTGGSASVSFSLSVVICKGGKALMTVRIRADGSPTENSWKLFSGRGTEGSLLRSVNPFTLKNIYYYVDNCLADGIYTFAAYDSFGDGWSAGAGYTLTVDSGAMEVDTRQLPKGNKPVESTLTFSSYIPFQMEYSDWKVFQSLQAVSENWKDVAFDDASWEEKKAANITNLSDSVTTYIRKTFSIPSLEDYQVLNVRVKYAGGVAVYFNGNMVARLNLAEEFDASTESITLHDVSKSSKFHVILATSQATEEKNVIAFEVHRPVGSSTSTEFTFDATGVFGVETCSAVLDSYASLTGSETQQGEIEDAMNLDPVSMAKLDKAVGTHITWTVENLLGTDFNSFVMMTQTTLTSFAFDLDAWYTTAAEEEAINAIRFGSDTLTERVRRSIAAPVGLARFQKLRFQITKSPGSNPMPSSIYLEYCKATGTICPAIDVYPAVAEGQISVSVCPAGYTGYSYRNCVDGQLGEVEMDHCAYKAPTKLRYPRSIFHFVKDVQSTTGVPTYENIVTRWFMDDTLKLPEGLTLNEETGEISGKPTEERELTTFTIYASNPSRTVSMEVQLEVRKGVCIADGVFQSVEVGVEAVYPCSNQGGYVGTKRRQCVLGEKDGEWGQASGVCVSVVTIVILILVVIVVIVVVVFVILRMSRKTKAVGGVKGKKVMKTEKVDKKKVEMKSVKVWRVCLE